MKRGGNGMRAILGALLMLAMFAAPASALEIKRTVLKNGAVLLISPQHQLPMVTIAIAFDAGSRRDPKGKAGLAALTASCLTLGTKTMTAGQFNQKVDFMGSSVSTGTGLDSAEAGMTSLKKYEYQTLDLLAAAITEPALSKAEILRKRGERLAAIKSAQQQPSYVANVAFRKALFGATPYGHPTEGTAASVAKLTPADVRAFYHKYYKIGSAIIAVVGDVDPKKIEARLNSDFAGIAGKVPPQKPWPAPKVARGIHPTLINRNVVQATLILGSGGIARSNPDYYRLQVMNYILGGGGFASRLMQIVRSKKGLAYGISSGFDAGKFPGSFTVITQTKNRSSNQALRLILQQLRRIQKHPVSGAELASAKKYLVGSFPLRIDQQDSIANFMLKIQLYGLGLDYADRYPKLIDAVTKADVERVARKYIHLDALLLVAAANQSEAKINVAELQKIASGAAPSHAAAAGHATTKVKSSAHG